MKRKKRNELNNKLTRENNEVGNSEKKEKHLEGFTDDEKRMIKLMADIIVKGFIKSRKKV